MESLVLNKDNVKLKVKATVGKKQLELGQECL